MSNYIDKYWIDFVKNVYNKLRSDTGTEEEILNKNSILTIPTSDDKWVKIYFEANKEK